MITLQNLLGNRKAVLLTLQMRDDLDEDEKTLLFNCSWKRILYDEKVFLEEVWYSAHNRTIKNFNLYYEKLMVKVFKPVIPEITTRKFIKIARNFYKEYDFKRRTFIKRGSNEALC